MFAQGCDIFLMTCVSLIFFHHVCLSLHFQLHPHCLESTGIAKSGSDFFRQFFRQPCSPDHRRGCPQLLNPSPVACGGAAHPTGAIRDPVACCGATHAIAIPLPPGSPVACGGGALCGVWWSNTPHRHPLPPGLSAARWRVVEQHTPSPSPCPRGCPQPGGVWRCSTPHLHPLAASPAQ